MMLNDIINNYYLRMESCEFLILVNKKNNDYVNIYRKDIEGCTRKQFAEFISKLERHPKLEN